MICNFSMLTSPVPDTYLSVESLELAVSPEHKMFPLVEQNLNSEELHMGETDKQETLAVWPLVFAIFEMSCNPYQTRFTDASTSHQGEVQPLLTTSEHLFSENLTPCEPSTSSWLEGVKYKAVTGRTRMAAIVVEWGISVLLWPRSERADFQCVVACTHFLESEVKLKKYMLNRLYVYYFIPVTGHVLLTDVGSKKV